MPKSILFSRHSSPLVVSTLPSPADLVNLAVLMATSWRARSSRLVVGLFLSYPLLIVCLVLPQEAPLRQEEARRTRLKFPLVTPCTLAIRARFSTSAKPFGRSRAIFMRGPLSSYDYAPTYDPRMSIHAFAIKLIFQNIAHDDT